MAKEIDVVGDEDEIAWEKSVADSAGRIGDDQNFHPGQSIGPHREDHVGKLIALVVVDAAALDQDLFPAELSHGHLAHMALHRRLRKTRYFRELLFPLLGEGEDPGKAGAEDHRGFRGA